MIPQVNRLVQGESPSSQEHSGRAVNKSIPVIIWIPSKYAHSIFYKDYNTAEEFAYVFPTPKLSHPRLSKEILGTRNELSASRIHRRP